MFPLHSTERPDWWTCLTWAAWKRADLRMIVQGNTLQTIWCPTDQADPRKLQVFVVSQVLVCCFDYHSPLILMWRCHFQLPVLRLESLDCKSFRHWSRPDLPSWEVKVANCCRPVRWQLHHRLFFGDSHSWESWRSFLAPNKLASTWRYTQFFCVSVPIAGTLGSKAWCLERGCGNSQKWRFGLRFQPRCTLRLLRKLACWRALGRRPGYRNFAKQQAMHAHSSKAGSKHQTPIRNRLSLVAWYD